MKTIPSYILKSGFSSALIFVLIILLCFTGTAFAARLAGTEETVSTTATNTDSVKKAVPSSTAETAAPVTQNGPSVKP
ncbi:MAG: hypothetical protein ABFD76_09260 [Smithella sp.]